MGITSLFAIVLTLMLGGNAGNELLDYIPSDAYWQSKGVELNADAIMAELNATADAERAGGGNQVKQLMAIRTLGELHAAEAVQTLKSLATSDQPFVGDYATRAVATIQAGDRGEDANLAPQTQPADDLSSLHPLPADTGLIAQLRLPSRGPVDIDKMFGPASVLGSIVTEMDGDQPDPKSMVIQQAIKLTERIGNVRIDCVTLALSNDIGDHAGRVTILLHGQGDTAAIAQLLATDAGLVQADQDGTRVLHEPDRPGRPGPGSAVFFPSDALAVITGAAPGTVVSTEDIAKRLNRPADAQPLLSPQMQALVITVDKSGPVWAACLVNENYAKVPTVAAFDILMLSTARDADATTFRLLGTGHDEAAVEGAVQQVREAIDQAVLGITGKIQQMEAGGAGRNFGPDPAVMLPAMREVVSFLKSFKLSSDGTTATVDGTLPNDLINPMALMFMF